MSRLSHARRSGARWVVGLVAAAIAVGSAAAPTQAASATSPAGHGATWLATQLHHGVIHNGEFHFDDYGLTIDTATALQAIGGHAAAVRQARTALRDHVTSYTTGTDFGFPGDIYAGAVAKSLVFAQNTGGGARSFGGVNLVSRLEGRVITSGPSKGRIQDAVDPGDTTGGDFANTIGQIYAVRGLLRAHSPLAKPAASFLLDQMCGLHFRLDFNPDKTAPNQGCTAASPADTDVTALAVVELWKYRDREVDLATSLPAAVVWLTRHQRSHGAFGGSGPTSATNTNSTGLASWALGISGRCGAAAQAAHWVARLQVGGHLAGTPLAGERGAIAYDGAALKAARKDGITTQTRDQWRRASSQAAPGLRYLGGRHCG